MLRRWLGHRRDTAPSVSNTTADPLAAIAPNGAQRQIYSVSRSVVLPRVALRAPGANGVASGGPAGNERVGGAGGIGAGGTGGGGINPLFSDDLVISSLPKPPQLKHPPSSIHHLTEANPASGKTPSSGYGSHGGSSHDPTYLDAVAVLEQNAQFVKSILVAVQNKNKSRKSVGSLGSSATGTLTTIPEGKVDFSIPRPVWPKREFNNVKKENLYDSLIDESLLLYTSLSYVPENSDKSSKPSANEILKDLSDTINAAVDGNIGLSAEQVLKCISDRLTSGLEVLQKSTEEDMKKLSVNLSNSERLNTVIRAFSNNSSSGNSSQSSSKCSAVDTEDLYQVPSGCSTSSCLPVFIHEDLSSVATGMRNALIYGTLLRSAAAACSSTERLLGDHMGKSSTEKIGVPCIIEIMEPRSQAELKGKEKRSLKAGPGERPSVWEMYYGGKSDGEYYPVGRPEADFTLDIPKSELLSRKMRAAKKWRFRCRIVTSFLGLIFFLLSLMAVSLLLTKGKRMFGSMV